MAKDAYYFSHDSNAKDDPKCVLLIEQLGMEGYGIFWVLIETLRDQPEYKYPLALIPALARRYNTTSEKVKTVVMQYGLFEIENDEFFYSDSLNRRMENLSTFRESQRKKALKRWNDAPALPRQCHGNADPMPVKESKVKYSKVKESIEDISSAARTVKHKYGEYQNVLLSDSDIEKLKVKFTDWQDKIETLSKGIELKGYKYKNHYLAILKWAEKDAPQKPKKQTTFDIDEYERQSVNDILMG